MGEAVIELLRPVREETERLLRDKGFQSNLRGLYPCGEGAGYAGGIVSAAVDGLRVAEAVAHPPET